MLLLLLFSVNSFHFLPIIAFFHVHRFFFWNFSVVSTLSNSVKLKTKNKTILFPRAQNTFVCWDVFFFFFFHELGFFFGCGKFDFTAFDASLRGGTENFPLQLWIGTNEQTKEKQETEQWRGNKNLFVFDCLHVSLKPIELLCVCDGEQQIKSILDHRLWETNEKNV